jgi:hypothetical protein
MVAAGSTFAAEGFDASPASKWRDGGKSQAKSRGLRVPSECLRIAERTSLNLFTFTRFRRIRHGEAPDERPETPR